MDERPDPDALLEQVKDQERRARRGKHTIFFGAAPGVGKTYAMLEAARAELERERRHVAVGVVETHGRYETAALVLGLPLLTQRKLEYRGVELSEFDLDEALRRRPELILMDELAHTNAEGSRHPKRWQDVEELLDAGIDVFSTMNVQHVESLNDVIAKITGVVVRETVPDSVLESAHDIKLVDLPPDDLLERLREGKVYVPAQAQRAIENFFRKGNLIALRELALRHTAERVDAQMRAYRHAHGIEQTWAAAEQLLVAVSPSPFSARLIRAGRRMASALHARWFAVFVEPPRARPLPERARARLAQNLRLAEQLGAEVVTLSGENASDAILRFSRERNITKIVVGKPQTFRVRDRFRVSLVDQIVRNGGDIDVYVTAGDAAPDEAVPEKRARTRIEVPTFLAAGLISAACTALALLLFGRDQLPDVVMTYLLGIMVVSSRFGLGPSLFAALLSVALVDFFFVPPYFTFAVADFRHAVTFAVMFLVAVVISGLTQRIRNQVAAAREREQQTLGLYALSREVAAARGREQVLEVFARHIERAFASDVSILLPDRHGKLVRAYGKSARVADELEREAAVSQWVWANQKEAGLHTSTLASNRTLYVPLLSSGGIMGVLGLTPANEERFDGIEQRRQVDAFATQLALAVERAELSEQTEKARREFETEQLRSSLLSSVSHDLRTPLAVITGAASTLVEKPTLDDSARAELTKTILEEAERLNRLIRNLLDMTRLDSGTVKVKKDWQALEEVVGAALNRLEQRLAEREVRVELPRALPLVPFDSILIEQTLINLLENAIKYGQAPIEITASLRENGEAENRREIVVEIADHGPGLPEGEESRVFEKFHRAVRDGAASGAGLGLAICRAIVAAHGGRIWAQNRPEGGVSFRFTLPLEGAPPTLSLAEAPEASELRA
ncbi:MAG TPA: sensor histidine kinase KdpD [Polyangiaceae bacterium]|nr:sensor histidine kinase KdpD [Polyangiaceae bacterium]